MMDKDAKKFEKHELLQKRNRAEMQKELDKQKERWDVVRKKYEDHVQKEEKDRDKRMREDLVNTQAFLQDRYNQQFSQRRNSKTSLKLHRKEQQQTRASSLGDP